MIQKLNLQLECLIDDHKDKIVMICYNQNCTEFRLNCFKCLKKGKIHLDHIDDVEKFKTLMEFIKNQNQACDNLINHLSTYIESMNQSFTQLKCGIRQKYSLQNEQLVNLNSQQLNDYLNSTVNLIEYKQSITAIISDYTKKITHQFNILYEQLKLSSFNYYMINDNDNQQLFKEQQSSFEQNNTLPQLLSPGIQNQQFSNQAIDEVSSLIKMNLNDQVKKDKVYHNQELDKLSNNYSQLNQNYENEKILLKETINTKDQQIQYETQTETQQSILQPSSSSITNQFIYEKINNHSIKQDNYCYAIAINNDFSIVIVGCKKEIIVYQLKQDKLEQTQNLKEHQGDVNALNFMKKSNQFKSGSDDNNIFLWSMNQSNKWILLQKLIGHNDWIFCQILNDNEDLIISGGQDKTIKFWTQKQNKWLCQQTITDHTGYVWTLSINQQQNQVISGGNDQQILIIEQSQKDSKWIVIQKIKVEAYGYRITFINSNKFTFQPRQKEQIHVYEMNNTKKQYIKTKDVLVKGGMDDYWFFPQQYIKSKGLLVNRNGKYLNLIRIKENGEFITEQLIEFGNSFFFGCMSQDGKYLITWEESEKKIQIRKYYER
ncbi:unnamed protein product [Paramecium pentaurelia]|uniref:WD40-repeat-containing domain n=1 Tax=Paramecium pentaurelia TaxID=43138 RepID=A0A8S1YI15_9CILI|nr:unnamed protein product [Paramecium pentaurelia]